jgi:hypothetical protein
MPSSAANDVVDTRLSWPCHEAKTAPMPWQGQFNVHLSVPQVTHNVYNGSTEAIVLPSRFQLDTWNPFCLLSIRISAIILWSVKGPG